MLISVLTGFAAGAVHVVSGADHMVAMAPASIRKPRVALIDGLAWGIGHSAGVLILSILGILAKDFINIELMSSALCSGFPAKGPHLRELLFPTLSV